MGPFGTQFFGMVVLRVLVRACVSCCIGRLPSKEHSYVHTLFITLRPCIGVEGREPHGGVVGVSAVGPVCAA